METDLFRNALVAHLADVKWISRGATWNSRALPGDHTWTFNVPGYSGFKKKTRVCVVLGPL